MVCLHIYKCVYIVSPIINVELLLKNYLILFCFQYITNAITILLYIYYILCLTT